MTGNVKQFFIGRNVFSTSFSPTADINMAAERACVHNVVFLTLAYYIPSKPDNGGQFFN